MKRSSPLIATILLNQWFSFRKMVESLYRLSGKGFSFPVFSCRLGDANLVPIGVQPVWKKEVMHETIQEFYRSVYNNSQEKRFLLKPGFCFQRATF